MGDLCKPCNCLKAGSESSVCDKKTGQCLCKLNVVGRQCSSCPGSWQEITRGCMGKFLKIVNNFNGMRFIAVITGVFSIKT